MHAPLNQRIFVASANIRPARILALGTSVEETAAEATGTTTPIIGVSVNALKFGGFYERAAVPFACETGDAIPYRGPGMQGEVLAGAAISNLGRPLTSDSAGRAVSITPAAPGSTVNWIVGFPADLAAAANEVIRVNIAPVSTVLS